MGMCGVAETTSLRAVLPELGGNRLRGDSAIADGGQEIVDLGVAREMREHVLELVVESQLAQLGLQRFAALLDVDIPLLPAEPLANLLARAGGGDVAVVFLQPVAARTDFRLAGHDFDHVAVLQLVVEPDHAVVDLGADAVVPDLGVNPIGKIERSRAGRQLDDVALRGEDVDLVLEDIRLQRFDELFRVADFLAPLHELAQPGDLGFDARVGLAALFVAPVRGHAIFGDLVHLVRADLDLEPVPFRPDHGRVQALVHALFWRGDVVVELARNRVPHGVDDPERAVAITLLVRPRRGSRSDRRSRRWCVASDSSFDRSNRCAWCGW